MEIVKRIKNNKTWYFWAKIIQSCKNEDFREYVRGFQGADILMVKHLGNLYPDKLVYNIDITEKLGFFGMVEFTLQYLMYAEKYHLTPYVNWSGCYAESLPVNGTKNVYEYYYNPVSEISNDDIRECRNVIFSYYKQRMVICEKKEVTYRSRQESCFKYGELYRKYFKLNQRTKDYIDRNLRETLNGKKSLGVHIRGTDFKKGLHGHPVCIKAKDFIEPVQKCVGGGRYEQIFLATDSLEAIELFSRIFGNVLVFYNDVQRADGDVGVHEIEISRKNHHYLLGMEVLRDVYTLAACDSLIAGLSNVSFAAQYIKAANGSNYTEVVTLDRGLQK